MDVLQLVFQLYWMATGNTIVYDRSKTGILPDKIANLESIQKILIQEWR